MFPQLIAGPIVRYIDIEEQLKERSINSTKFGEGAMYFIRGLAKKVVLANTFGSVYEQVAAMQMGSFSTLTAWVGSNRVCIPDLFRLRRLFGYGNWSWQDVWV